MHQFSRCIFSSSFQFVDLAFGKSITRQKHTKASCWRERDHLTDWTDNMGRQVKSTIVGNSFSEYKRTCRIFRFLRTALSSRRRLRNYQTRKQQPAGPSYEKLNWWISFRICTTLRHLSTLESFPCCLPCRDVFQYTFRAAKK